MADYTGTFKYSFDSTSDVTSNIISQNLPISGINVVNNPTVTNVINTGTLIRTVTVEEITVGSNTITVTSTDGLSVGNIIKPVNGSVQYIIQEIDTDTRTLTVDKRLTAVDAAVIREELSVYESITTYTVSISYNYNSSQITISDGVNFKVTPEVRDYYNSKSNLKILDLNFIGDSFKVISEISMISLSMSYELIRTYNFKSYE